MVEVKIKFKNNEEEKVRNLNAKCSKCAHYQKGKVKRDVWKRTFPRTEPRPEKVLMDYCSSYREVIRNEARAKKCKRYVEKKEVGALDEFIS